MKHWLVGGEIRSDKSLRGYGWTDETLRAPHAWPVRYVEITDRHGAPVKTVFTKLTKTETFKPTHIYTGVAGLGVGRNGQQVYLAEGVIKKSEGDLRIATFNDNHSMYILETEARSLTLLDDIDALCLSIQKRQSELTRLVKQLKG